MFLSIYWVAGKEVELKLADLASCPNIFPDQLYDLRQLIYVCRLTTAMTIGTLLHVSMSQFPHV